MIKINVVDPDFVDVSFFVDHPGYEDPSEIFREKWVEALYFVRKEYKGARKAEFIMQEVMKFMTNAGWEFSEYKSDLNELRVYLS